MRRPPRIAVLLVASLGALACSGDDGAGDDATSIVTDAPPSSSSTTTTVEQTTTTGSPTTTSTTSSTTTSSSSTSTSTTSPPSSTAPADAAPALTADGIGDARFGMDPDEVVAALSAIFGAPDSDSGWVDPFSQFGTCPGTEVRGVVWGDLTLLFGDSSWNRDDGVRHFFAYHYGPPAADELRPPGLVTDRGIGVGSSIAELRAAYPDVDIQLGEEGIAPPTFYVSDLVRGYITGDGVSDTVTSILGGVGCGE